jgi:hypothetical protein
MKTFWYEYTNKPIWTTKFRSKDNVIMVSKFYNPYNLLIKGILINVGYLYYLSQKPCQTPSWTLTK